MDYEKLYRDLYQSVVTVRNDLAKALLESQRAYVREAQVPDVPTPIQDAIQDAILLKALYNEIGEAVLRGAPPPPPPDPDPEEDRP